MSEERVLFHIEDQVGVVTLNRPHRHNALDDESHAPFARAMERAFTDPDVRAILLRGNGPSFCSGRDTAVLGHRAGGESDFHFVRNAQEGRLKAQDCPKPIVAAMKGYALGGGFELALSADIRVASEDAKMALPEILYGILPDTGGSQLAAVLAGPSRAKYLVMTGDRIDAHQALAWGLVDFVVPLAELDAFSLNLAKKLAAQPPIALAMAKQLIDGIYGERVRSGIRNELLAQTALFKTEDYREARSALKEKRKPRYQGK